MLTERMKTIYICFPGGRHKALTLSYDDGREEDRRLVGLLNRYGLKGTFHLNSGFAAGPDRIDNRIPPEEWNRIYQGHEIACHTVTHPTISRCPMEQTALQILEDRRYLERIAGYPVRGLSYPNGSFTKEIADLLPSLGIAYSRVTETTGGFGMPEDFYQWKGTCHHSQNLMERAGEFLDLHKSQYLYLMYVWGHSYEFTNDDNWDLIEEFCRMAGGKEEIWYATNIEIADYMNCAKMLHFTVDASRVENMSGKDIWLSVDGRIVEVKSGAAVNL